MKNIQIHCIKASDKKRYILNRMTGENTEAGNNREKREALMNRARRMAHGWSTVFPHDKIEIVEV